VVLLNNPVIAAGAPGSLRRPRFRPANGAAFGLPHLNSATRLSVAALIVGDQYLYKFAARSLSQADEEMLQAQVAHRSFFETPVIRWF
jgi:hypothetical protein